MATYRSRVHVSLRDRLVDAALGTAAGFVVGVLLWLVTLAWWAHG